jgi:hypothetical protein
VLEPFDAFLTLAEVGVGLAGFAGIALALTRRDAPLTAGQVVFVRELILNGLAVIFLALAPVGATLMWEPSASMWGRLSALHALLVVLVAWPSLYLQMRAVPSGEIPGRVLILVVTLQGLVVAVQSVNATSFCSAAGPGLYFLGLCGALGIAAIHFARLLFDRLR